MKFFAFLFSLTWLGGAAPSLLVIDMNGKKPLHSTTAFSADEYMARNFPVYSADLPAVIQAIESAAKYIDRKPHCNCMDSIAANNTLVLVQTVCGERRTVTVRLVTRIPEQRFLCDFELVRNEENERKAQRRLIDFTDYLSRQSGN